VQKKHAIIALLLSGFLSFILAVTVDMSHYELGGLINLIWPAVVCFMSLLLLLLLWWIIKNLKARIIITVLLCLYNVYVGLALHIEKDYWPLVMW
jgi:hypothetical protein